MTTDKPELDRLDALLAEATPGPWRDSLLHGGTEHDDGSSSYRGGIYPGDVPGAPAVLITNSVDKHDAALIAAAVNALPALIAAARERDVLAGRVEAVRELDVIPQRYVSRDYKTGFDDAVRMAHEALDAGGGAE